MTVLSDMSTAPIAGESTMPCPASTPAAKGIATMLAGPAQGDYSRPVPRVAPHQHYVTGLHGCSWTENRLL